MECELRVVNCESEPSYVKGYILRLALGFGYVQSLGSVVAKES